MERYFNTTGYCDADYHYMVAPFRGFQKTIYNYIERKQYFVIHAPRQTGKTTLLHALAHQLNQEGQYIAVATSLEVAGWESIDESTANRRIVYSLYNRCSQFIEEQYFPPHPEGVEELTFQNYLQQWATQQSKPIVLLLDEVDALLDDILISVLRQLRDGFQGRLKGKFPASVALVGLRDIRDYRMKARGKSRSLGKGSPFNIKVESLFMEGFSKENVVELYQQHTDATQQIFPREVIDLIYELTSGQPWLTNAIAHEMIDKILQKNYSKPITLELVEQAKERLIARRDTHLDSLLDKMKEQRVKNILTAIVNGDTLFLDNYDDDVSYCRDLGIIAPNPPVRFANDIYKEIIVRIMNSNLQENLVSKVKPNWYITKEGQLDMDKLLQAFQKFYRRHSEHWIGRFKYKEAGQQLLLMAFLQRVVNGNGRIDREMAAGSGRTDIVVEWKLENGEKQVFVLELKLKYYPDIEEEGLEQLWEYLDKMDLDKGYLVLFELKSMDKVSWEKRIGWKTVTLQGKEIVVVEM